MFARPRTNHQCLWEKVWGRYGHLFYCVLNSIIRTFFGSWSLTEPVRTGSGTALRRLVVRRGRCRAPLRLLPATGHTAGLAGLGAHAPGALQPRASGTTGAAASSFRGLGDGGRGGGGRACGALAAAGTTAFPSFSLRTPGINVRF